MVVNDVSADEKNAESKSKTTKIMPCIIVAVSNLKITLLTFVRLF